MILHRYRKTTAYLPGLALTSCFTPSEGEVPGDRVSPGLEAAAKAPGVAQKVPKLLRAWREQHEWERADGIRGKPFA